MAASTLSPAHPALQNPAVAHCVAAWTEAYNASMQGKNKGSEHFAEEAAVKAYRLAMPALSSGQDIRDFIACTAHGILIGAIGPAEGARLLYAVQVAKGAVEPAAKKPQTA